MEKIGNIMVKFVISILFVVLLATGCSMNHSERMATTKDEQEISIDFWTAPANVHQVFWREMAQEYAKVKPNVKINVSAMPEAPTSEAGILAAIAGGTAPTISENVFRGFAAQLAENKAIIPLDTMEGFEGIIRNRYMEHIMDSWKFSDGHQYVFPIFSNPSLFVWRVDILKEVGVNEPPKTYSEVIEAGKKLKQKYPDKYVWVNQDLVNPTWYKRWWDFLTLYAAASQGNVFVQGDKLVADDKAAVNVLKFFYDLKRENLILAQQATDPFETGLSVASQLVPFKFVTMREKYPELKYKDNFVVTSPPVPDGVPTTNVKTIADSKGLVIYAQASEQQQKAAWEFVKWVFSKSEHDLKWLEVTNLLPARGDLATNVVFAEYLDKYPELQAYVDNVKNAIPAIDNPKFVEIQGAIGEKGLIPILTEQIEPEKAWDDVKKALNAIIK
jgi:multiple sugar transport system substrate-binding protein